MIAVGYAVPPLLDVEREAIYLSVMVYLHPISNQELCQPGNRCFSAALDILAQMEPSDKEPNVPGARGGCGAD